MIIWQGLGFLGLLIPMAMFALGYTLGNKIFGQGYSAHHGWPGSVALLVAAMLVWLLDFKITTPERTLIDPATGQTMTMRKKHTLFWIPLRYVALLIVGWAVYALINPQSSI
jgi:hypothetical protein